MSKNLIIRKTFFALLILWGLSVVSLGAQERLVLGGRTGWEGFSHSGITFTKGYKGWNDAVLADSRYQPSARTDLLLHWDSGYEDLSSRWEMLRPAALTEKNSRIGEGCAVFRNDGGTALSPGKGSMFAKGTVWKDFSLEFWLYPAALSENEEILLWKGRVRHADGYRPQEIRCAVSDRRITWVFDNFFMDERGDVVRLELAGGRMLPRRWSHHRIRFDSTTGLLEYLVDGVPADSVHASSSGRETYDVFLPRVGESSDPLEIGRTFTGFMDEFRLTDSLTEDPVLARQVTPGKLESGLIDLGFSDSELLRIDAIFQEPDHSRVYFEYCQTNDRARLFAHSQGAEQGLSPLRWVAFRPGETLSSMRGRYVLVRMELHPDSSGEVPPSVSEITLVYEPSWPPAPPQYVSAEVDNGDVIVRWRKPSGMNITGYLIYLGDRSGVYHTYQPIDAGLVYEYRLTGLKARKLYYIAITAYTGSEPRQYSAFSREVAVRP